MILCASRVLGVVRTRSYLSCAGLRQKCVGPFRLWTHDASCDFVDLIHYNRGHHLLRLGRRMQRGERHDLRRWLGVDLQEQYRRVCTSLDERVKEREYSHLGRC